MENFVHVVMFRVIALTTEELMVSFALPSRPVGTRSFMPGIYKRFIFIVSLGNILALENNAMTMMLEVHTELPLCN